jgi:hypothetical protein
MNPPRLIDLVIGDVPRCVGVPMVSQFKFDIPKWNANVATLALGSQPRQRLAKVQAKRKPGSHISCS